MKTLKKSLALLLCAIMLLSSVSVLASATKFGDYFYTTKIPTVYLTGQGSKLFDYDESGNEKTFYPAEIPDGYVGDAGKSLLAPLAEALATNNWNKYAHAFASAVNGAIGDIGLDNDGNAKPGQHPWANAVRPQAIAPDGTYFLYAQEQPGHASYYFNYDWRLDPFVVAKQLKTYIDQVKKATGQPKVNLIGRCLGANVVLAYINEYDTTDIAKILFYSAGLDSFTTLGCLFSGKIKFDEDSISRFIDGFLSDSEYAGDPLFEFANSILPVLEQVKVLGVPVNAVNDIYAKIKNILVPEVLLSSYATMPGFWALIGDDYYEAAKKFLFSGKEEQYAGLIEKIDNYHEKVAVRMPELIDKSMADGSEVYIVAKYGLQIVPTVPNPKVQSDTLLETKSSSLGATCSAVDSNLPIAHIDAAKDKGTTKYISPDFKVDASTCYLPDHTWFIKNLTHLNMPTVINELLSAILDYDGYMTVFDDDNFPQYMNYNGKTGVFVPLTWYNGVPTPDVTKDNIILKLINMLKKFIDLVIDYVKNIFK